MTPEEVMKALETNAVQEAKRQIEAAESTATTSISFVQTEAINAIKAEKDELIRAARLERRWFVGAVAVMLILAFMCPIVLFWSYAKWATFFDANWARVVAFCVPQILLCIVCVVALVARSRETEY